VSDKADLLRAVIGSHAVILVIQSIAKRYTSLPKSGLSGLYLILLSVGFNVFGAHLHPGLVGGFVLVGVLEVLYSLRLGSPQSNEQPSATCSVPPGGDT